MPFIQSVVTPQGRHGILYNVEQSVGIGGVNAREDVRLVQELLRISYGKRAEGLVADGWIGPTTNGWIKRFQEDFAAVGNRMLVDGRVDRAMGAVSSVSKTVYAIILLNLAAYRASPAGFNAVPQVARMNPTPKANPYNAQSLASAGWRWMRVTETEVIIVFDDGRQESYRMEAGKAQTAQGQRSVPGEGEWEPGPDGRPQRKVIIPESGGF